MSIPPKFLSKIWWVSAIIGICLKHNGINVHINHFFHDFQTLYNLIQLGFLGMFCVLKIDWKRLKDFKEWYLTCYIDHIQRWFNKIDKKWRNMKWRKLLNIDFTTQLKFLFKNQLETNGSQVNITKKKLLIHFEVDFLLNWKTWNLNGLRTFGTHFFWRENLPFFFIFAIFWRNIPFLRRQYMAGGRQSIL